MYVSNKGLFFIYFQENNLHLFSNKILLIFAFYFR